MWRNILIAWIIGILLCWAYNNALDVFERKNTFNTERLDKIEKQFNEILGDLGRK